MAVPQMTQSCPRVTGRAVAGRRQEKARKTRKKERRRGKSDRSLGRPGDPILFIF